MRMCQLLRRFGGWGENDGKMWWQLRLRWAVVRGDKYPILILKLIVNKLDVLIDRRCRRNQIGDAGEHITDRNENASKILPSTNTSDARIVLGSHGIVPVLRGLLFTLQESPVLIIRSHLPVSHDTVAATCENDR